MIGYYADVGYAETTSRVSNISKITFTDEKRPFTFPVGITDSLPIIDSFFNLSGAFKTDDENEMVSRILGAFLGQDFYKIYGAPSIGYTEATAERTDFFLPSYRLSFPNIYTAVFNGVSIGRIYLYIPSLKRVFDVRTNGTISISRVESNGNISFLADRPIGNYTIDYGRAVVIGNYDGTKDSILNGDNYILTVGKSSNTYFSAFVNGANYDVHLIFDDFDKPDFELINPYEPGGPSGPGGGGGTFDDESDPIGIPPLPTLSSANTGFTRIYNPTLSQVQELAQYLWTDESVIQTIWNHIKQFFENPMEAIIGFNLVPVPVPNGGTKNFALMYIDTGVSMTVAANQFVDVDCGTLEIKPYYGSALDYSPYTKISCYLPYIGMVNLDVDEVMGRTLQVKYRVDICSGSCVAYVLVDSNALYQFSGHCAIPIPISAADFTSYVSTAINIAKLAGGAYLAGSGILAPPAITEVVQQTGNTSTTSSETGRNPSTGRQITLGTTTTSVEESKTTTTETTKASYAGLTPSNVANTVGEVISSKPHVEHSGGFSGNSGYLGVRRPFVIIKRPNMCMPSNYQALNGFPSMLTLLLGDCSGFTRIQQVQLTGLTATNPEQAEILELLKSGVIF